MASAALWLRYFRNKDREQAVLRKKFVLFFSVFSVYVIGIGWELFEFSLDRFITFKIHDAANTASDLFFDGVGGLFAVFLFFAVYNKYMKMEN